MTKLVRSCSKLSNAPWIKRSVRVSTLDVASSTIKIRGAARAEFGLIPLRQALDEGVGVGQLGGGDDFLVAGARPSEADVLHHGVAEQEALLQDDADLLPQAGALDAAHVVPVGRPGAAA